MVRRVRRELGRAGVDGLVGDRRPRPRAARRARRPRPCPRGIRAARPRSPSRLARRQSARSSSPGPRPVSSARASTIWSSWSRNHGSTPVASCRRSTDTPRRSAASSWNMPIRRGRGRGAGRARRGSTRSSGTSAGSALSPNRPDSRLRRAFWSDSVKVRPIAMTSPTDCICVPRIGLRPRELLERPPRHLGDHVVDRRLERRGRLARDVVHDLVEPVADREARRDLRDREPRRLAGERARARDAWVHLDHHEVAVGRVDRELDVGAARCRRRCGGCMRTRRRASAGTRRR